MIGEKICPMNNMEKNYYSEQDVTIKVDEELEEYFEQLPNIVINMERQCLFEEDVTIPLMNEKICETINLTLLMDVQYILPENPYFPIVSSSFYNILQS